MQLAGVEVVEQSNNLKVLHWQTSLNAPFDPQRVFPALANPDDAGILTYIAPLPLLAVLQSSARDLA